MAPIEALKFYLIAEQQLFHQHQGDANDTAMDDATLIRTKIEMSFRISASIYKLVVRYGARYSNNMDAAASSNGTLSEEVMQELINILQRDKSRLFTENQLAKRAKRIELVDENANTVNGNGPQQNRVSA